MNIKIEDLSDLRVSMGNIYLHGKPYKVVGFEDRKVECIAKQRNLHVVTLIDGEGNTAFINVDEVELAPIIH